MKLELEQAKRTRLEGELDVLGQAEQALEKKLQHDVDAVKKELEEHMQAETDLMHQIEDLERNMFSRINMVRLTLTFRVYVSPHTHTHSL